MKSGEREKERARRPCSKVSSPASELEGPLPERGPSGLRPSHSGALETARSFSLKRFLIIILGEIRAVKNGANGRTAFLKSRSRLSSIEAPRQTTNCRTLIPVSCPVAIPAGRCYHAAPPSPRGTALSGPCNFHAPLFPDVGRRSWQVTLHGIC